MIARRYSWNLSSGVSACVAVAILASVVVACTHPPTGPGAAEPLATNPADPRPTEPKGRAAAPKPSTADQALPAGALDRLPGRGEVRVGDAEAPIFHVELAKTAEERAQGLMYRRHLADDAGMVFDMERSGRWAFWMKNTLIPLDMVFIDRAWRVVCVVAAVPPETLESRGCDADSRWVLELASGVAARHQIVAGTALRWKQLPDAPPPRSTP